MLFQLFTYITGGERRKKRGPLSTGEDPDGDAETLDVLAAIEKFPPFGPTRRRLSRRSIRCSRASIRSHPRPKPRPDELL
jgi:sulfite reductase (NADPH) flavoprotein alpha-component